MEKNNVGFVDEPVTIRNMKKKGISVKTAVKKLGFRNMIGAVSVIVFFTALITILVVFFYYSLKSSITLNGELQAEKSAASLDHFMSQCSDVVKEARYDIDKMIEEKNTHKEMIDYMVNRTENIRTTLDDKFTGVYGYVQGEYMDGALWVPEPGYVPEERPWYKKAVKADGELVLVEPYLDSETGEMTMTAAELCNDKKSVVALDIKLNMMQQITGQTSSGEIDMVIDSEGAVIAHTDKKEIGHNYLKETGTLGNAITKEVLQKQRDWFEFDYDGTNYLVYDMSINDEWHSIALIDTKESYMPLRVLILVTVIIIIITIVILTIVFISMGLKSLTVEELNVQLTETSYMTEKAIAESEAKTAFLSNMSHEIRTPINAVLGMNEMILRECDDKEILEYSSSIKTAGDTLLGLVNNVLDFSKIEANKMEILPVEYELSSVLNDLVNMVRTRAEAKDIALKLDFDSSIPNMLFGDEVRIKQIITNILTNAVKYTEEGSIIFSVKGRKEESTSDEIYIDVKVSDTGIGIKKEDIDKLFNKFDRIEQERNRNIEGTGLGMAITSKLLELMDSKLEVESEYGKGSVFGFAVKQKIVKDEPLGDYEESVKKQLESRKQYHEKFNAPMANVLVVDDTPINLVVFKNLLKATKIQIDEANDGFESLAKTKQNKYDIIFLDHMMPEMDGIKTLEKMKEDAADLNRDTPVICLTANAVSGAREKYISAGFDDYLTKPIDSDKLEDLVYQYLPKDKIIAVSDISSDEDDEMEVDVSVFASLSGLDVNKGLENCGSAAGYKTVLDMFYKGIKSRVKQIQTFFDNEDWENYTIKVHALKSSARIIGATELSEDAYKLEKAGKENRHEYIIDNNKKFLKDCLLVREMLEPVCGEGAAASKGSVVDEETESLKDNASEDAIKKWMESIAKAAEDMDVDEIEDVLNEAGLFKLPEETKALFEKIKEMSTQFNYDEIIELIGG